MGARAAVVLALLLSAVFVVTCDKATLVAPVGATITLSVNPTRIEVRGTATVTAIVRKENGTPVNPGTLVNFSTTLGTIDDTGDTDDTGIAKATLMGDGRIGIATVEASTGAVMAVSAEVQIGSLAASIVLTASKSDVPKDPQGDEGVIGLLALIRDDTGAPLANTTVNFSADIGSLASRGAAVITNELGEAEDTLTVDRNNISVLSAPFFEVGAEVATEGGQLIEDRVEIQIRGVAATITLQATPTTVATEGGTINLFALVRDNLGDPLAGAAVNFLTDLGRLASGGSAIFTDERGEARDLITVDSVDTAGLGGTTFCIRAQTAGFAGVVLEAVETVRIQSLVPVASFTVSDPSPFVGQTINLTFTGTGEEPLEFEWDFENDGTVDSTQRVTSTSYGTPGSKTIRLRVTNPFGEDTATTTIVVM